jgi:3'-phosphoadenosine 5'-phosphosulfate sulfotransferase (PAPS reductase)/FAD synthetase
MKTNQTEKLTPLADAGVTEAEVWEFWNNHSFDLELPKFSGASNCTLCFLKAFPIITGLINQKPERAIWWAAKEKEIGALWRSDRPSYTQMLKYQKDQMPLFDIQDESIGCFCGD